MKTDKIYVNSQEIGMADALTMMEKAGNEQGLDKKQNFHLRLLSEELFGMLKSISGGIDADYWAEIDGKKFEIHMKSEVRLTEDMKKQLLAASSSGENAAAKGFMGKIKVMIAEALFVNSPSDSYVFSGLSLGLMSMASPSSLSAAGGAYLWSMDKYKDEVKKEAENDGEAAEAWDELEKSIVANVADEVQVKILGNLVEIIVSKAF